MTSHRAIRRDIWPLNLIGRKDDDTTIIGRLGDGFNHYLKIFHSVYIDLSGSGELSHEEVAGSTIEEIDSNWQNILADSILVGQGVPSDLCDEQAFYRRILWRDLFESKELPFKPSAHPEILGKKYGGSFPSNLYGLVDYGFDCKEIKMLEDVLQQYGCFEVNCYYDYLSSGQLGSTENYEDAEIKFVLNYSKLHCLIEGEAPQYWSTPNCIWETGRSFVIWSDYDLPYSFVACDDLFYRLLAQSALEFLEVDPKQSFSYVIFEDYISS